MFTSSLSKLAKAAGRFSLPSFEDACAAAGIAAVAGGAALVYLPAGLIALGLLLLVVAVGGVAMRGRPQE